MLTDWCSYDWCLVLITFAAIFATTISDCPPPSKLLPGGTCVHVDWGNAIEERKRRQKRQATSAQICRNLKIGSLDWYLPKVNTTEKADAIFNIATAAKPFEFENENLARVGFWIGMRRQRRTMPTMRKRALDPRMAWYWTRDNTTADLVAEGYGVLWGFEQPDNGKEYQKATGVRLKDWREECVFAVFMEPSAKSPYLRFHDAKCTDSVWYVGNNKSLEIAVVVCEAKMSSTSMSISTSTPTPTPTPISSKPTPISKKPRKSPPADPLDHWWFYLVCSQLIIIPVAIACLVYFVWYPTQKSSQKSGAKSPFPRSRRWSRKDRKDRKKKKKGKSDSRRRSHVHRYEKYADELTESHTLEADESLQLHRFKVDAKSFAAASKTGLPRAKKIHDAVPPAKLDRINGDDENHVYSNVRPNIRPPKVVKAVTIEKKMMTKAKKV